MPHILCPYCLEPLAMNESLAAALTSCPTCARDLGSTNEMETAPLGYEVHAKVENPHTSTVVQEYVHALEEQARREESREPPNRARPPVDLLAGVLLVSGGIVLVLLAFTGEGGLMSTFVNVILPAMLLILLGVACLICWAK